MVLVISCFILSECYFLSFFKRDDTFQTITECSIHLPHQSMHLTTINPMCHGGRLPVTAWQTACHSVAAVLPWHGSCPAMTGRGRWWQIGIICDFSIFIHKCPPIIIWKGKNGLNKACRVISQSLKSIYTNIFWYLSSAKRRQICHICRVRSQWPLDLQSNALPLSYTPYAFPGWPVQFMCCECYASHAWYGWIIQSNSIGVLWAEL